MATDTADGIMDMTMYMAVNSVVIRAVAVWIDGGNDGVSFVVDSKDSTKAVYRYYPENHIDSPFGIITVYLNIGDVSVDRVAEEDFLCRTSANELNSMRDAINDMRRENGEPPLTEDELPTATKDDEWYYYADHVIRRIKEELENGNIPEKGTVAWY